MLDKIQKICVTGFIHKNGKILIIKRSSKENFLPGYFEMPGGKINFGEPPIDALKRELKEEVNLDVEIKRPYHLFSYTSDNNQRHTVDIQFLAMLKNKDNNIKLSDAHETYQWIDENELNNYKISNEMKNNIKKGFELIK